MLQANGKISLPIFSMLVGVAVKIVSAYFLVGLPQVARMGAPLSTLLCNLTAVCIDLYFIEKYTSFSTPLTKIFTKPLAFSAISALVSVFMYMLSERYIESESVAFAISASVFAIVYLCGLVFGGAFDSDELELLPFGKTLCLKLNIKICKKRT